MNSSFLDNFKENNNDIGIKQVQSELEEDTSFLDKQRKKKVIMLVVVITSILIISIFIVLSKLVSVPEFTNNLSGIAEKWGKSNNIEIIKEEEYNNTISEGIIISQSVKEGKRVFKNSSITITVSKGKNPNEIIELPDILNTKAPELKEWKQKNDLKNITIKEEFSNTISKGSTIRYEFESVTVNETNFTRSDKLTIYVSKGQENLIMEDFTSKYKDEVISWCEKNSMNCKITEKFNKNIEPNMVISQSIQSGTTLIKGSEIIIEISLGEGIIVPNYYNVSSDEASEYNDKVKIKLKYLYNMQKGYGELISQSVKAGTQVSSNNNEIILTYSLGIPYFKSLVGVSESEIAKTFYEYNQKGVNFTYDVKYVDSEEQKGIVVWGSKDNEFVTMKEHIEIHVSNGTKHNDSDNDTKN